MAGRRITTTALAAVVLVSAALVPGRTQARTEADPLVSIDVKEADIHQVFRLLARVGGVDIVVAGGVQGRVTVRLEGVSWRDAFRAVLVAEGLEAVKVGDILVVDSPEHLAEQAAERVEARRAGMEAAPLRTIVIPVNYARAEDLARVVRTVLSDRGSVVVDTRTNTLIVTEVDDSLERVRDLTE